MRWPGYMAWMRERFGKWQRGADVERIEVRGKLNVTPEQMADGRGVKFFDLPPEKKP